MANFDFKDGRPPRKREEGSLLLQKTPRVEQAYKPWKGVIKSIHESRKPGHITLFLVFGAKFFDIPNKDYKVGQSVQILPLGRVDGQDQYEITPISSIR